MRWTSWTSWSTTPLAVAPRHRHSRPPPWRRTPPQQPTWSPSLRSSADLAPSWRPAPSKASVPRVGSLQGVVHVRERVPLGLGSRGSWRWPPCPHAQPSAARGTPRRETTGCTEPVPWGPGSSVSPPRGESGIRSAPGPLPIRPRKSPLGRKTVTDKLQPPDLHELQATPWEFTTVAKLSTRPDLRKHCLWCRRGVSNPEYTASFWGVLRLS